MTESVVLYILFILWMVLYYIVITQKIYLSHVQE